MRVRCRDRRKSGPFNAPGLPAGDLARAVTGAQARGAERARASVASRRRFFAAGECGAVGLAECRGGRGGQRPKRGPGRGQRPSHPLPPSPAGGFPPARKYLAAESHARSLHFDAVGELFVGGHGHRRGLRQLLAVVARAGTPQQDLLAADFHGQVPHRAARLALHRPARSRPPTPPLRPRLPAEWRSVRARRPGRDIASRAWTVLLPAALSSPSYSCNSVSCSTRMVLLTAMP